jgi:hypothetical protein
VFIQLAASTPVTSLSLLYPLPFLFCCKNQCAKEHLRSVNRKRANPLQCQRTIMLGRTRNLSENNHLQANKLPQEAVTFELCKHEGKPYHSPIMEDMRRSNKMMINLHPPDNALLSNRNSLMAR